MEEDIKKMEEDIKKIVEEIINVINKEKDRINKKINEIFEENLRSLIENKEDFKSIDILNDIATKVVDDTYKDINLLIKKSKEFLKDTIEVKLSKLEEQTY